MTANSQGAGAPATSDPVRDTPETSRAGYVLLAGLPNAGKSTLLNALVGEALSAVTPKAQTTWQQVLGIRTDPGVQMVFLDTPGLLTPSSLFQRSMIAEAERAREDADVAVVLVDGTRPASGSRLRRLSGFIDEIKCPKVLVVNKIDEVADKATAVAAAESLYGMPALPISAKTGAGLPELLGTIAALLPESPFLFASDEIAQAPVRFFVQELIRETLFEHFEQEIPYASAVQIDAFREDQDPIYIGATIYVERKSQKGMVVGKSGSAIRGVGADARAKIEHFLDARVYLDLWVKVAGGWRKDRSRLSRFGYRVPDDED